jgi:predicted nucleotide-binding protein (sugar kinase/HSP70/actin superfamily)
MKITFPYMGTPLAYKKLLEMLGHETISPPKPNQRTFDLGVKHSPEFACFPLKVIMGSYLEAIEQGAEVIVTSGGHGPCRAGFYGELHKKILKSLGYDVEVIVFDSIKRDFKTVFKNVRKIKGSNSWWKLIRVALFTYRLLKILDNFEKQIQTKRAYEVHRGNCTKVWDQIQKNLDRVYTYKELKTTQKKCQNLIDQIQIKEVPEEKKIRIGIVGEIYVVMESGVNMRIEEILGGFGCEVRRSHYLSQWIDDNVMPKFLAKSREKEILKKGEKYIRIQIGGHAKETMGHIVDYCDQGFDGIVHLMPFGCLPELVCQSIMPKTIEELNIPVLTIALDEQTGIANNLTRIEAFVDLVKGKKRDKVCKAC